MGAGSFSDRAYRAVTETRSTMSREEVFTSTSGRDPGLDPRNMKDGRREARDNAEHPNSRPVIVAFDVTGSMHTVPELFAREKLGNLMAMLVSRGYVADPQVCFAAIGDHEVDSAPFQVGEFESSNVMDNWLTKIFLEGGGGGGDKESYCLAHHFAVSHVSSDAWEKRGEKGYLFTLGDERSWDLSADALKRSFGCSCQGGQSMKDLIVAAQERYHVYHIHVGGSTVHANDPRVRGFWTELLGQNALFLADPSGVAELIAATIGLNEGAVDMDEAAKDMSDIGVDAALVGHVTTALATISGSGTMVKGSVTGDLPATKETAGGTARL